MRNTDLFTIVMVPVVIRLCGEMAVKISTLRGCMSKLLRDKNHHGLVLVEDELTKENKALILKLDPLLRRKVCLKLRQKFSQRVDLVC